MVLQPRGGRGGFEPQRMKRRVQYWADIARVPLVAYNSVTTGGRTVPLQYQMYGGQIEGTTRSGREDRRWRDAAENARLQKGRTHSSPFFAPSVNIILHNGLIICMLWCR